MDHPLFEWPVLARLWDDLDAHVRAATIRTPGWAAAYRHGGRTLMRSLAVIRFGEDMRDASLAPYFISNLFRVHFEMLIALREIAIDSRFADVDGLIVTAVNHRLGH